MLNYAFGPKTSVNYSIPVEDKWSNQFQSLHESETITGGPDLPIFATGPGAPAFSGINSLSYVYHALVFATCLANNSTYPHCKAAPPPTTTTFKPQTTAGMLTTRKPVPTPSTPPPTLKPIPQTPRPLPSWPWLIQPQQQYNPNPYSNLGDSFLNSLGNVRPMQPMQPWQPMPPMQPVTPTPPPAQNNNPWAWASLFPFFF
ncbi:uncharacterized protein LOC131933092 [Physella acuta]|uniref:uncharacterized protein LOC131933092 n=1 Tax=Physella acuta TaxID=109671 RepID=UPI0027DBF333|nr:uncharacterized protein LOC131933092 [Physella acuta]